MNFLGNMGSGGQLIFMVLLYAIIFGGMYFVIMRPQQKRKKQEEEMKKNLQIGDEIVTIGGIMGRVISIKEDTDSIVLESGADKIRIKRWAISSVNTNKAQ